MKSFLRNLAIAAAILLVPVLMIGLPDGGGAGAIELAVRLGALGAVVVALVAATLAAMAFLRVRRLESDLTRYARSVETLLRRSADPARASGPTAENATVRDAPAHRTAGIQEAAVSATRIRSQALIDIETDATVAAIVGLPVGEAVDGAGYAVFPHRATSHSFLMDVLAALPSMPEIQGLPVVVPAPDDMLEDPRLLRALLDERRPSANVAVLSLRAGHAPLTPAGRETAGRLAGSAYRLAIDLGDALAIGADCERLGIVMARARAPALLAALGADGSFRSAIAALPRSVMVAAIDVADEADALALASHGIRFMAGPLFADAVRIEGTMVNAPLRRF